MSKAEERAFEVYPKMSRISEPHGIIPADNESHYIGDANEEKRIGFMEGYEQAEKDLALTWEDIEQIQEIANSYTKHHSMEPRFFVYKEILKRFKERKEK